MIGSQKRMESNDASVAILFGFIINTTAYHLGRYNIHLQDDIGFSFKMRRLLIE